MSLALIEIEPDPSELDDMPLSGPDREWLKTQIHLEVTSQINQGKPKGKIALLKEWGGVASVGGLLVFILAQVVIEAYFRGGIDGRFTSITSSLETQKSDSRLRSDRIDLRLDRLENILLSQARTKAVSIGLQDPQVQTVSLNQGAEYRFERTLPSSMEVKLKYAFLRISPTSVTIRVDGTIGKSIVQNTIFTMSLELGKLAVLPRIHAEVPRIYFCVVERPSPEYAILAIGTKSDQT